MSRPYLTIIIPFHSDSLVLQETINTLLNSQYFPLIKNIYLCHNGLDIKSFEIIKKNESDIIKAIHTPFTGLGAGCREGIKKCTSEFLLITGSDLPFKFSDMIGWLETEPGPRSLDIVIGSKSHPQTLIYNRSFIRRIASVFFNILKKLLIPINLPDDSQGTIFIRTEIAKKALNQCREDSFFFTTELLAHSIFIGATYKEIPVIYKSMESKSSVAPFKDGLSFLGKLYTLRTTIARLQNDSKK